MAKMNRFTLFLVSLLLSANTAASSSSNSVTIIDRKGIVNKGASLSSSKSSGVVAILSDSSDDFSAFAASDGDVSVTSSGETLIVTSPGATLTSHQSMSDGVIISPNLMKGFGSAAASSVASSIILSSVTLSDCQDIDNTRHGKTLFSIFSSKLLTEKKDGEESAKTLLIVAVSSELSEDDKSTLMDGIKKIFDTCAAQTQQGGSMSDLYDVQVVSVKSQSDVSSIMELASSTASNSPVKSDSIISSITESYTTAVSTSANEFSETAETSISSQLMFMCEDSYARNSRQIRSKLSQWKNRVVSRNLVVDKFGSQCEALLKRTMDSFDRDTIACAGRNDALDGNIGQYRLELRSKLFGKLERSITDLYEAQIESIGKTSLKKFNQSLLKQSSRAQVEKEYQDNAALLRAAVFSFDTQVGDLEVPSLNLKKTKYTQEMTGMLNQALMSFPDSPDVKLREMRKVQKAASRSPKPAAKKATERSINTGLSLVAMVRPDGFGNLQGFAGYNMGPYSFTVGVHNDADAPETISQFGGSRPPFLRVQPQLNLDVEL